MPQTPVLAHVTWVEWVQSCARSAVNCATLHYKPPTTGLQLAIRRCQLSIVSTDMPKGGKNRQTKRGTPSKTLDKSKSLTDFVNL